MVINNTRNVKFHKPKTHMTISTEIKKHINQEIDKILEEVNIDAEVEKYLSADSLRLVAKNTLDRYILDRIALKIEARLYQAIEKKTPIIDVLVKQKIAALMMGFTEYIAKLEEDVEQKVKEDK